MSCNWLSCKHDAELTLPATLALDCHAGGERSDPYTISWALGGDRTVRSGPPLPLGAPGKEARCQSPESGAPEREDPSGPAPTPWARLSRQWGETWAQGAGCRPGRGGQVDK